MKIEEPGTTCVTLGIFLERKKVSMKVVKMRMKLFASKSPLCLARSVPGRGAPSEWTGFGGELVERYVEAV
jgi:hypothetical protein